MYGSTRGEDQSRSFRQCVLKGLADDGGLFVPLDTLFNASSSSSSSSAQYKATMSVDAARLASWRGLSYADLAFEVLALFMYRNEEADDSLPREDLRRLVRQAYDLASFSPAQSSLVPIVPLISKSTSQQHADGPTIQVAELFNGPTLSFKDFALQLVGLLFEYFLAHPLPDQPQQTLTIVGATSGDTGSAAIAGVKGKEHVSIYMLHPKGRVSPLQQLQMTTVEDLNVFNIAVEGSFDDCQAAVKGLFSDLEFKRKYNLAAVNSINWARILAQTVYYFYIYLQGTSPLEQQQGKKAIFSVPTGNFGNVLSGYYAMRLGLPIEKLIVATNQNDILHRFFETGVYEVKAVEPSISPAMDITVASNFERFLYHMNDGNAAQVKEWMTNFQKTGKVEIPANVHKAATSFITSIAVSEEETLATISKYDKEFNYLLCPHSAIAVYGAEQKIPHIIGAARHRSTYPFCVSLATAHPAKFAEAIEKAVHRSPVLPKSLADLLLKQGRSVELKPNADALKSYIEQTLHYSPSSIKEEQFYIRVPGSCANLGSGFDTLGLAVDTYLHVDVKVSYQALSKEEQREEESEKEKKRNNIELHITYEDKSEGGEEAAAKIPTDKTNLIWKTVLAIVSKEGLNEHSTARRTARYPTRAELRIRNQIPLARGLGSSGSAVVCGVLLANRMFNLRLFKDQMLAHCSAQEGHPDNVGASLYGGIVLCCPPSHGVLGNASPCQSIPLGLSGLKFIVAVPDFEVSTEEARSVLPKEWRRVDVVYNLQRVGSMVLGLITGNSAALQEGIRDMLHQPYRAPLNPALHQALALNNEGIEGLIGVCLSGSGSSILALATSNYDTIKARLEATLKQRKDQDKEKEADNKPNTTWRLLTLLLDTQGATLSQA